LSASDEADCSFSGSIKRTLGDIFFDSLLRHAGDDVKSDEPNVHAAVVFITTQKLEAIAGDFS
jgi:hypothetical protein